MSKIQKVHTNDLKNEKSNISRSLSFHRNVVNKKKTTLSCQELTNPIITVKVTKPLETDNSKLSVQKSPNSLKSLNKKLIGHQDSNYTNNYVSPHEIFLHVRESDEAKSSSINAHARPKHHRNQEEVSSMSSNSPLHRFGQKGEQNNLLNIKKEYHLKCLGRNKSRQYMSNSNADNLSKNEDLCKLNRQNSVKSICQSNFNQGLELLVDDSKSRQELEVAQKMKNILFCSISHELRNPINHINGILECIGSYVSPEDHIQQFVNIALSSTNLLMYKIDDIMDYSLLETNTLKLRLEECSVRDMLSNIQDILCLQFDNSLLNFSIYVSDTVPEIIVLDNKRVKQVLINLIFNAIKYTEKGYVTVIVDCQFNKLERMDRNNKYQSLTLNFAVSDSGCGIEKK